MRELLKIVVTDSAGVEHLFNEESGVVENYINLIECGVKVTVRVLEPGRDKFDMETECIFMLPRRVDISYERTEN